MAQGSGGIWKQGADASITSASSRLMREAMKCAPTAPVIPLRFDDEDVLLQIVYLRKHQSDGSKVTFDPSELMAAMGWTSSQHGHQRLIDCLERLTTVQVPVPVDGNTMPVEDDAPKTTLLTGLQRGEGALPWSVSFSPAAAPYFAPVTVN